MPEDDFAAIMDEMVELQDGVRLRPPDPEELFGGFMDELLELDEGKADGLVAPGTSGGTSG